MKTIEVEIDGVYQKMEYKKWNEMKDDLYCVKAYSSFHFFTKYKDAEKSYREYFDQYDQNDTNTYDLKLYKYKNRNQFF